MQMAHVVSSTAVVLLAPCTTGRWRCRSCSRWCCSSSSSQCRGTHWHNMHACASLRVTRMRSNSVCLIRYRYSARQRKLQLHQTARHDHDNDMHGSDHDPQGSFTQGTGCTRLYGGATGFASLIMRAHVGLGSPHPCLVKWCRGVLFIVRVSTAHESCLRCGVTTPHSDSHCYIA